MAVRKMRQWTWRKDRRVVAVRTMMKMLKLNIFGQIKNLAVPENMSFGKLIKRTEKGI